MPRNTPNLNLFVPDPGQSGIAAELNSNYDAIDGTMDPIGGHKHTGAPGAAPKIAVANIDATGTPDATTYLRGDGQWAAGSGGGSGVTDHGALTGLADDDHLQYHTQARGDARWLQRASNLADVANAAAARAALDAAQTAHVHAAADVSSGVMAPARLGAGAASSGTFLRGDGQWATVAGTGVGGSGLAGRAAFWSAVSTLSGIANSIFWDSVNGRLGIGTEAPGAPVTIVTNALSAVSSGVAVSSAATVTTPLTGTSNVWSHLATYDPTSAHSGSRIWAGLRANAAVDSTVPGLTLPLLLRGHNANAQNLGSAILSGVSTAMYAQVSNLAAGSMANASAVSGLVSNSGSGVMTVAAALRALRPANSGTIGDVYGLYVENQTPSSGTVTGGKYGIYQEGTGDINALLGKLGIGQAAPTALVHIKAGTAAPNTAPLKLTAGTLLTAIEDGTIEYSSAGFFASHAGVRTALGGAGAPQALTDLTDVTTTSPQTGQILRKTSGGDFTNQYDYAALTFVIDGGGATITTGIKGDIEIPFGCVIERVTLLADVSGSIVLDLWRDSYANYPPVVGDSITASAKPTISSALKAQDTTLTGWLTTCAAGDILRFNVDSVTTVGRVTCSLRVRKT